MIEPVSVALKYGFVIVMYLFLLWIARSALKDMRGRPAPIEPHNAAAAASAAIAAPDATGMFSASTLGPRDVLARAPRLVVERAPGHQPGMIYDLDGDVVLGRGSEAEIRLEDPFASSSHARIFEQGGILAIEDIGSTNGTYLNEELLESPRPLHRGDRVRIGDSEFTFEVD
jgi:pSer/pThr/pTyr-binding forkhead associated (FHA) protein